MGSKELMEAYFGGDLTPDWVFIGAIFTMDVESGFNICPSCEAFTMVL